MRVASGLGIRDSGASKEHRCLKPPNPESRIPRNTQKPILSGPLVGYRPCIPGAIIGARTSAAVVLRLACCRFDSSGQGMEISNVDGVTPAADP
jgi:hypothetical protein